MWPGRSSQIRGGRPDVKNPVVAIVRYDRPMESVLSHRAGIPVDTSSIEKMDKTLRVVGRHVRFLCCHGLDTNTGQDLYEWLLSDQKEDLNLSGRGAL